MYWISTRAPLVPKILGSFSIDDSDGTKTSLVKWIDKHFLRLCCVYFNLLKMFNVGINFPGVDFLGTALKFKFCYSVACFNTSSIKHEIRHFHAVVVQKQERNVQKAWCTCKLDCFSIAIAFLTFLLASQSSLLKLPTALTAEMTRFRRVPKNNHSLFSEYLIELKSDIRSCQCKNFSIKQVSGLIGVSDPLDPSLDLPLNPTPALEKRKLTIFFGTWH